MSAHAFWAIVFFGAFAAFTVISALIAVKGVGEIRELFDHLDSEHGDGGPVRRDGGR